MKYYTESLRHTIRYLKILEKNQDKVLLGESLLQLIRDIYHWKSGKSPFRPVTELALETGLELSMAESGLLSSIEFSLRKQEKYLEAAGDFSLELMAAVREKAEALLT